MALDRSDDTPFADWELESEHELESFRPEAMSTLRERREETPAPDFDDTRDFSGPLDAAAAEATPRGRLGAAGVAVTVESLKTRDEIGGFRLVAELGRGAFARVFLAHESSLGGRLVALKISPAEGDEPQVLARLQHANIVPVHSVHDDPATGLRLLCMPYLGGANLARVLEESWALRGASTRGRSLVDALDLLSRRIPTEEEEPIRVSRSLPSPRRGSSLRVDGPASVPPTPAGEQTSRRLLSLRFLRDRAGEEAGADAPREEKLPSRRFLREADHTRAAVWVGARLAEGLAHAHSRGLLHRDLKPSNVLVTSDGTPMLLDFNLSVDAPVDGGEGSETADRAMLGGTLPYMAPEHLDALDPEGNTPPEAVDERSDLYALGLILFEMIAGQPAFPTPEAAGGTLATVRRMHAERRAGAPSLRSIRPEVPPSLDALVAKCLAPEPNRRHRGADELAEDLRRFLEDLPMRHGPEPSPRERFRKWARRHPSICSSSSVGLAAVVLLGLLMFGSWQVFEAMQGLHARLKLRQFQRDSLECRFLLNTFGDSARVGRGLDLAESTLAAAGVDEAGGVLGGAWIGRLGKNERDEARRSIVDLVLQSAHARIVLARKAPEAVRRDALEEAVERLDRLEASAADVPSSLFRRRSSYRDALGDAEGAERDRLAAEARPATTAEDWTAMGMLQLADGDLAAAERSLRAAVELDIKSFWAWFALGHCHFARDRFGDAVADFTACVVERPDFAWGHFNLGLARGRNGQPREARAAYDRALKLDPAFDEARANRGLVELELNRPDRAEADLRAVIKPGRPEPRLAAALADALIRQGKTAEAERMFDDLLARSPSPEILAARGIVRLIAKPEAAARDFRAALDGEPNLALAHYGMARVQCGEDSTAALDHLDRAIAADPSLYEAVELRALERARRGDRAALDDVAALVARPSANRLYNAACALAILGEASRASDLLGRAILAGFPADDAEKDADLATLRGRADYAAALARRAVGE